MDNILRHSFYRFEVKRLQRNPPFLTKSQLALPGLYLLLVIASLLGGTRLLGDLWLALYALISVKTALTVYFMAWGTGVREYRTEANRAAFVLTGMDAQTVLLSKWLALAGALWQPCLILWLVRAALLLNPVVLSAVPAAQGIRVEAVALGGGLLLLLTAFQFVFMAGCGLMAAAISSSKFIPPLVRAVTAYLLVIFSTALALYLPFLLYSLRVIYLHNSGIDQSVFFSPQYADLTSIIMISVSVILDTGAFSLIWILQTLLAGEKAGVSVLAFMATLAIYTGWIWISVKLSIRGFARRGLPVKSKRRHSALTNPR